jgi:glycosyltransferase involved in cell wall biosynthesis
MSSIRLSSTNFPSVATGTAKHTPRIGVVIMAKNEADHIVKSLESVKPIMDVFILYDTGSTDNTVKVAEQWCIDNQKEHHCLVGTFVNFEISRNVALDFAETFDVDILLLLDVSDELQQAQALKEFLSSRPPEETAWMIRQEWWAGGHSDSYYNMRIVKAREGWRYIGAVHEYIQNCTESKRWSVRVPAEICLYQDRTKDGGVSATRYARDRELLLGDLERNPSDSRTLFYLAQTCNCLGLIDEAIQYYTERLKYTTFTEEEFHSTNRLGCLYKAKGNLPEAKKYWIQAFEQYQRIEPIIELTQCAVDAQQWKPAYWYVSIACEMEYPNDCILFVNKYAYQYLRWHLLGRIGYYCDRKAQGKLGCEMALKANPTSAIDLNNLKFYLE